VTPRIVLLVALAAGCGKKTAAGEPPAEGEVAGVVLELHGDATAQSPGQSRARALRPGAELVAGDVIATAEDASLRARLYHNRAVLVLGGGKMLALRDSPAWKARPSAGSPLDGTTETDTAVAGRQAEPEAADTRATASGGGANADSEKPGGDNAGPTGTPVTGGDGGGGHTSNDPTRSPVGGGPDGEGLGTIGETGSLGHDDVKKGLLALGAGFEKCWDKTHPGALEFKLRLRVTVRPDGTVAGVEIETISGDPPPAVKACVANVVRGGSFPRSKRGVTFTYPVEFRPGE